MARFVKLKYDSMFGKKVVLKTCLQVVLEDPEGNRVVLKL